MVIIGFAFDAFVVNIISTAYNSCNKNHDNMNYGRIQYNAYLKKISYSKNVFKNLQITREKNT